jgi:hypothetical protein
MPIDTEQFLGVEFLELPTHVNELSKAEDLIEKLKHRLEVITMQRTIDDKSHDKLYEETCRVLDYVGKLSMPAFAVEDQLEEMYAIKFKHTPALAKKLWLDHYEVIHKPYTLLKNRCYRLLTELDKEYFKQHKKHPPNWKI